MIVGINASSFDPLGSVELDLLVDQSNFGEVRRRANRIATLDGGAVFNDFGYTHADRTISLVWRPESLAQKERIERLVRLYSDLIVSVPDGVYRCAPEAMTSTNDQSTLTLLVKSKES